MVNSENDKLHGERGTELELLDSDLGPARPLSEREVAALSERLTRGIGVARLGSRRRPLARLLLIGAATTTAAAAAAMYGTEWLAPRTPEASPPVVTDQRRPAPAPTAP